MGDVLKCCTNHLGRTSILEGWWFGVVWTGWSSIFLFILFFKSSLCKIASVARNWINSVPQTAATTSAFSCVYILIQCEWDSLLGLRWTNFILFCRIWSRDAAIKLKINCATIGEEVRIFLPLYYWCLGSVNWRLFWLRLYNCFLKVAEFLVSR